MFEILTLSIMEILCLTLKKNQVNSQATFSIECHVTFCHCYQDIQHRLGIKLICCMSALHAEWLRKSKKVHSYVSSSGALYM